MIARLLIAGSALALLAAAAPPADPAILFGAREGVEQISLSPSGSKIAFVAPMKGQGNVLYTVDSAGGSEPKATLTADGDPERIRSCGWVSEARLVCDIYMVVANGGDLYPMSRMVAVDAAGTNLKVLSMPTRWNDVGVSLGGDSVIDWLPGDDGAVLMGRNYVPEEALGTRMLDKREGYGVDRLDTRNLSSKLVEAPRKGAGEYISDGHGNIRIMGIPQVAGATQQSTGFTQYFFRKKGSHDWEKLSLYNSVRDSGFNPYAVDSDLDVVYGLKRVDGRLALYTMPMDGSGRETLVYSHPAVDVDGIVRIGRSERVVGATFVTEKRQAVYFDKNLQALAAALSKALPGLPLIRFVSASADESKLLLWAGSDVDSGRYYLFDKPTKHLTELMLSRPELEGLPLAAVKPITYRASDGTEIPAYLTMPAGAVGKNLPAIVMPHGGPGARDEWGFDWLAQYFASRGFVVLQPNFRGSTGYGDAWFQKNGFQSWRTAIGDVDDAGRWLVKQGIADPSKLAIFGWSYGGYAALQANVLDPNLFRAAVAVAPVTDLASLKEEWAGWTNHRLVAEEIGSGPHVREGSPAQNADKIAVPVLIFHGERDRNVGIAQSRMMADRLKDAGKKVDLVVYPKLDHYLEDSQVRADMLRRTDAFLRAALKM